MIRRFALAPIFLALWGLWFIVPTTRDAARAGWQSVWSPPDAMTPFQPASGTSRDALVVRASGANDKGKSFEKLGQQFPGDASICAGQLLLSVSQLKLGRTRQAGPACNPDPNWSVKLSPVERPSPRLLKSWFAATARGAKLEPQNTFFDWMQILGLLAARRDDEVWAVLKAARFKTGFDDHANASALASVREGRRQNSAMSPLAQVSISFAALFPHFAAMRQATREMSENAYGLRLRHTARGDRQALEGMRDLVLLARTMRFGSKVFIGSLVGQAMEDIALCGGGFTPTNGRRGRLRPGAATLPRYAVDPRSLLRFAQVQHRRDVATLLSGEWVALGVWQAKTKSAFSITTMEGMDGRDFTLASGSDWLGWRLLAPIPFALGGAVLCSLLLRLVPALRRERDVVPSRASWAWGAALGALSILFLVSPALWTVGAFWKATGTSPINIGFPLLLNSTFSTIGDTNVFSGAPRSWSLAFPASFLFVCALWFAASWDAKRRGHATLGARLKRLFRAPDDGLSRFDVAPLLGLIGVVSALCAGSGATLAFLILPVLNPNYASVHVYAAWVLLGLAFVMALPAWWRLRGRAGRAFALRLAARFAWTFAILASLGWGALTLATRPAHRRFEAQLDRFLQVGEFQLARKRLGI